MGNRRIYEPEEILWYFHKFIHKQTIDFSRTEYDIKYDLDSHDIVLLTNDNGEYRLDDIAYDVDNNITSGVYFEWKKYIDHNTDKITYSYPEWVVRYSKIDLSFVSKLEKIRQEIDDVIKILKSKE